MSLPEAHTDYIFSVIGEEFGLIACATDRPAVSGDRGAGAAAPGRRGRPLRASGGAGLTALLGGQAFINILVNLQLFPSKGMTLPLVSYGGSSTIAVCLNVGLLAGDHAAKPVPETPRPRGLRDLFGMGQTAPMKDQTNPIRSQTGSVRREIHP